MKEIYEKHYIYLDNKKIKPEQILSIFNIYLGLLEKLKNNSSNNINEEEKDFKKNELSKVNEDDEDDYYKYFDYETEDLNKLDTQELKKHKDRMEKNYFKNAILPNDENFVYNKEVHLFLIYKVEFKTDGLKSEWDQDDEEF